jgi:8-oxo-dGTP pyrophosphatase MutT (NUDIX family)
MSMIEYVSGLMFNHARTHVWLLHKAKGPKYLIDRWNGPGGKVQQGESYDEAMVREWREETGMDTDCSHWEQFVHLTSESAVHPFSSTSTVRFYRAFVDEEEFALPRTTETEEVFKWPLSGLPEAHAVHRLARNLPVLLALALDQSGIVLPVALKDLEEP